MLQYPILIAKQGLALGDSTIGQTFFSVCAAGGVPFSLSPSRSRRAPPIAVLRTPGLRTRRHPDLIGGVRSVDAVH